MNAIQSIESLDKYFINSRKAKNFKTMNKKNFRMMTIVCMALFAAMFSSCKKDEDKKDDRNTFSYDGETYAVIEGVQLYTGKSSANSNGIILMLRSDQYVLGLMLFVPTNKDRLVAHSYVLNDTKAPYTVHSGAIGYIDGDGDFEPMYEIEDLDIDVSLSKETYTVNVSGAVDGSPLTGNYTGELAWSDRNDLSEPEIPRELVGIWKFKKVEIGALDTSVDEIRDACRDIFTELSENFHSGDLVNLNEDGTGVYHDIPVTFSVEGSTLNMTDNYDYPLSFSYAIYQGKLILTLNGKQMILDDEEISTEVKNYLRTYLNRFTIDFTYEK